MRLSCFGSCSFKLSPVSVNFLYYYSILCGKKQAERYILCCKQSSGGVMLLREEIRKLGVPVLILDGDALDRRNSHDGQIRTRLEAFLEMLDQQEGQEQKHED